MSEFPDSATPFCDSRIIVSVHWGRDGIDGRSGMFGTAPGPGRLQYIR